MTKSDERSSDTLCTKLFCKLYADFIYEGIPCIQEFARGISKTILFLVNEI